MPADDRRPGGRSSRRNLLAAAGGLMAAGLAGCGSQSPGTPTNPEFRGADADVLDAVLGVANRAVAAYAHAATVLTGAHRTLAVRLGVQEAAHVYALTGAVDRLAGSPSPAPPYQFTARDGPGALRLAAGVEEMMIAYCLDALPKLTDLEARGTVLSIAARDAQHAVLIAQAQGLPPAASPIVRGQA